jgi:glycerol-3-phosphate dehydrogenase
VQEFDRYLLGLQQKYAWLEPAVVARYARAYGTRTDMLLAGRTAIAQMGEEIAPGLYAAEVDYLMQHEWAGNAVDVLWRRTKLGLHLPPDTKERLDDWIKSHNKDPSRMTATLGTQ